MEEDSSLGGGGGGEGGSGGGEDRPHSPWEVMRKGKSCKGCLYYSSLLKSNAHNPICVGFTRPLPEVPGYIVGESEMEATKDGRSLSDFKYACVGYSMYLDNKNNPVEQQENQTELPFCVGIELLVDRTITTADQVPDHVPAHVHNKEDGAVRPQPPRTYKPSPSFGEEFFSRFTRNAGLVASGVARNLRRVGNYVKDNLDDILYPYRRRPK